VQQQLNPAAIESLVQASMDVLSSGGSGALKVVEMPSPGRGSEALRRVPEWPDPPGEEAFHGIVGEIVRAIEPHTETDMAGLLVQFLVAFGSLIGRCIYFMAEADKHYSNLFANLIGQTAKGRKGTSWGIVGRLLSEVDEA
jgi:hypothetical protein